VSDLALAIVIGAAERPEAALLETNNKVTRDPSAPEITAHLADSLKAAI
jgi:hypothetical protein